MIGPVRRLRRVAPVHAPGSGATVAWSALILSGGESRRMGSDKAELVLDPTTGHTQLHRTISACFEARTSRIVVVGPTPTRATWRPTAPRQHVVFTRENDRFSGPVNAIAAGLPLIESAWTMLLPVDLVNPAGAVAQLMAGALNDKDACAGTGWEGVDHTGRRQHLTALIRTEALNAALSGESDRPPPKSARDLMAPWNLKGLPGTWVDLDTVEDVDEWRRRKSFSGSLE